MNPRFGFLWLLAVFFFAGCHSQLNIKILSPRDQKTLNSILAKTEVLIEKNRSEKINPNWLEIEDLKKGLTGKEKKFIEKILRLTPAELGARTPPQPFQREETAYQTLENQPITQNGKSLDFLPPLVSLKVYTAFEEMMTAMERDTGKRLYIESGHRSLGYHLYNFLKYLREHQYSLTATAKLNALPGYSQHNIWVEHALDLISKEGINGEPKVEDYERLPEHQWMLNHAGRYGFTLSYPRKNPWGIEFEPWHWKYSSGAREENQPRLS